MPTISALGIGSGLDLNGLLDQLDSAEREKMAPLIRQKNSTEAKISAYGKLRSGLESFQNAAEKLNKSSLFESVTSSVIGENLTAVAKGATPGTWQVSVSNLAVAYSASTVGIADSDENLGAGSVDLELANGETISITLDAEKSSLKNLRDAINEQDAGIRASIVNDGSDTPYRLSLTATETGTDAAITAIDFGALASSLAVDPVSEVLAENADLVVNGVAIVGQSNVIQGAIEGVTLNLLTEGDATVSTQTDNETIETAVKDFVSAYNTLQGELKALTAYDEDTEVAGELLGDNTTRSIQSRLRGAMADVFGEGSIRQLNDLGISLQLDGSLEIDNDTLSEQVTNNLAGLDDFFAADDIEAGFAGKLESTLKDILQVGGVLTSAKDGLESRVERYEDRQEQMDVRIQRTVERYRKQFASLDALVAEMNSTSAYVTQQFNALNAQLNN